MALSGPTSYVPTAQEMAAHWEAANTALGGGNAIVLRGGYTRTQFLADITAAQAAADAIIATDNGMQILSGNLDAARKAMLPRITQFRLLVKAKLPGTGYSNGTPTQPPASSNEAKFMSAVEDMRTMWSAINGLGNTVPGFQPPITLANGYALGSLNVDAVLLRDLHLSERNQRVEATRKRDMRDALLTPLRDRIREYRETVQGTFPKTSPLYTSLPIMTPKPGTTPDPVNVSALWNPVAKKAKITWTPSENPDLSGYSIRTAPGPVYRQKDETIVADLAKSITEFETSSGLVAEGATAIYKVYVLVSTGNEKGSSAVKVTYLSAATPVVPVV